MTHEATRSIGPASARDRRRRQLIDATLRCISEHGLSGATLARVAGMAGLSTGIVNFYFDSKKQLLLETLRALSREYMEAMELAFGFSDDPAEILRDVFCAHFDGQICTPEKISVWYAFSGESRARRDYLAICRDHDSRFRELLLGAVTRLCRRAGNERVNAVALSRGLEGLLEGCWQDFLYEPAEFDPEAAIALCQDYLAGFLGDIEAAGGEGEVAEVVRTTPTPATAPAPPPDFDRRTGDLLAPWTYRSAEFLELEKAHLFRRNWLLAGHISEVPEARDYLTFDAFGERALVVRGDDRRLRAFHNVCRHRGAKLVEGARGRCRRALTCPFHGWTYRLDGALAGVPAEHTFAGFDKAAHGLAPLALEVWMGLVFVRFGAADPRRPTVAQAMRPVERLVAPYQLHGMKPVENSRFDELRRCNWKVIHDVDNEGYHVRNGHPGLWQLYGKNYRDDFVGDVSVTRGYLNAEPGTLWSVRHYQKLLPEFSHLPPDCRRLWLYIGLFPNMVLALYPDSAEFYMTVPVDAENTRLVGASYAPADAGREARAAQYLGARINRVAGREDDDFVRRLRRGMQSSAFPAPRLSSVEHGVRGFHRQIQDLLPVARLVNEPRCGALAEVNAQMR